MFVSSRTICFSANSGKLLQDGIYNSKTGSPESRKKTSFHEKLKLLNSGKFQWIETGRVRGLYPHLIVH